MTPAIRKRLVQIGALVLFQAVLLFLSAGRLSWGAGWAYAYVRHPAYASQLVSCLVIPLMLGSVWAYLPVALFIITLIVRTALEDRTLQNELEGYKEYAGRVQNRLIPGVW